MNSLDFDQLKQQIAKRLSEKGPAISEAIAHELGAPHRNVRFALEQWQSERKESVKALPFGFWDVTDETEKVA